MGSIYGFRNPGELVVNATTKCNQMCLNCPNDDNFRAYNLTKDEVLKFIDENWGDDIRIVSFIGGEPTISPFLFDILFHVLKKKRDLRIHINSNGMMFYYQAFCDKFLFLKERGFDFHIEFGFYSPFSIVHDQITQVKGSWDKSLIGLKNLLSRGFDVGIRTVVSKMNYKTLKFYGDMIRKENLYRISSFTFIGMDVIGMALQNKDRMLVSHLEIAPEIEKAIANLINAGFSSEKIQIHLLPKALFSPRFRQFVVKSGCVGGAFMDNGPECKRCIYYNECPHLLKSYVQFYGFGEHEPVIQNRR
ncbi:MAG: hypothetical protein PWR32_51 [Candidatus Woesearchaeota archaeon]|nr:hypothetical protein [Candidatus Woesearchaeota archaeon]